MDKIFVKKEKDMIFWKLKTLLKNGEEYEVDSDLEFFRKYFRFFEIDEKNKKFQFPQDLILGDDGILELINLNGQILFHEDTFYNKDAIKIKLKNLNDLQVIRKKMGIDNGIFYIDKDCLDLLEEKDERIKISLR